MERKEVSFRILFCKRNENEISCIIDKLEALTNYKVKFRYFCKTSKVISLFALKDLVIQKANIVNKGTYKCSEFYVGETKPNSEVRYGEHYCTKKTFEVGDHILLNTGHTINWEILTNAPKQANNWKILENLYIQTL